MLTLLAKSAGRQDAEPFVARIATSPHRPGPLREREALVLRQGAPEPPAGFRAYLAAEGAAPAAGLAEGAADVYALPEELGYLTDGDIVRVSPRSGDVWVLYRRHSRSNSMLLTERCNSDCVMCSQPPRSAPDEHLLHSYLEAIPLMDTATPELGITGGEPTLLGEGLLRLIRACRNYLPGTALHMLSNGRMFSYLSLCRAVADVGHPDLVVGIPLYSDIASYQDYVVQAAGAFDQTTRGIMGLERCGVRVEIRVVLHRQTVDRLPQLARFIARNLPFVEHVALMGLETVGYVRTNLGALWIDPADYQPALREAVDVLVQGRMNVSIYNHQLCVLDPALWPLARKSISDWKNEYLECCGRCAVRNDCGGFFSSMTLRRSEHIAPILPGAGAVAADTSW